MTKRVFTTNVIINVPFMEYDDENLNKLAEENIREYIKDIINDHLSYIPISVEEDQIGNLFDDCSQKSTFKIK